MRRHDLVFLEAAQPGKRPAHGGEGGDDDQFVGPGARRKR
jgi:hypothetical protein